MSDRPTPEQIRRVLDHPVTRAIRAAALEEAAQACEDMRIGLPTSYVADPIRDTMGRCAAAVRALKDKGR